MSCLFIADCSDRLLLQTDVVNGIARTMNLITSKKACFAKRAILIIKKNY